MTSSPRWLMTLTGFRVDLGFECCLQRLIGVGRGAEKIGVPDEEAFLVVVRVDEPKRDRIRPARFDIAGLRVEYVHALDRDLDPPRVSGSNLDVRLTKNDE